MKHFHDSSRPQRSQCGFTLIELMVVLAIVAIVAVYTAQRAREAAEDKVATASADNLSTLGKALATYMANNTPALSVNATTGITVAELQALGACGPGAACLAATFSPISWMGGYTTLVRRIGVSAPYQFDALTCTDNAWVINGTTRGDLIGNAVLKAGGAAGMTYDTATGATGNGGGWGPLAPALYPATNVAGKLCYYVSQSLSGLDQLYLRTDGTNQMLAPLRMNTNPIQGATTINATGLATVGSVSSAGNIASATNITATGNLQGANVNATTNITAGANITATGNVAAANVAATTNITAGNNIIATGNVQGNNVVAANDVTITSLPTRNNPPATTSVKALLPTLVEINSVDLTTHGQAIAQPTCPNGGTAKIFSVPTVSMGLVNAGRWGADIHITATNPWTFYARDAAGTALTASVNPPIAIGRIFCSY